MLVRALRGAMPTRTAMECHGGHQQAPVIRRWHTGVMTPIGTSSAVPRFTLRRLPAASEGLDPGLLDTVVDWGRYVEGIRCPDPRFDVAWARAASGDGFLWVGVHGPNLRQLTLLGDLFDIRRAVIDGTTARHRRSTLERHGDVLVLSLSTLAYVDSADRDEGGDVVETGSITVFIGQRFALTVRALRHTSMGGLRDRIEADPERLVHGPSAVLHAVVDQVVDGYLAVMDAVNTDVEEIETAVFGRHAPSDFERIYQLKRDVIETKHAVIALSRPVRELADRPRRLVNAEMREYFRDVSDHLDRVREQVSSYDEMLSSILRAGLARLAMSENEDMRRISAWIAIAAVPTMIAAIYGMNFAHMPELRQVWGYPLVITAMLGSCAALYRGFSRNGWL